MFLYNKLHRSNQRFDGIEIHNDGCSEGEGVVNVQLGIVKDMKWYKRSLGYHTRNGWAMFN